MASTRYVFRGVLARVAGICTDVEGRAVSVPTNGFDLAAVEYRTIDGTIVQWVAAVRRAHGPGEPGHDYEAGAQTLTAADKATDALAVESPYLTLVATTANAAAAAVDVIITLRDTDNAAPIGP